MIAALQRDEGKRFPGKLLVKNVIVCPAGIDLKLMPDEN